MRPFRFALFALFIVIGIPSCGGNADCKSACTKITSCALKSSGLSCDSNCTKPDDKCAICVNDKSCADIQSGKCAADCPNATFTK